MPLHSSPLHVMPLHVMPLHSSSLHVMPLHDILVRRMYVVAGRQPVSHDYISADRRPATLKPKGGQSARPAQRLSRQPTEWRRVAVNIPLNTREAAKSSVRESEARLHAVQNGVTFRASLAMRAYAYECASCVWLCLRKRPKRDLTNKRLCVCVIFRARANSLFGKLRFDHHRPITVFILLLSRLFQIQQLFLYLLYGLCVTIKRIAPFR